MQLLHWTPRMSMSVQHTRTHVHDNPKSVLQISIHIPKFTWQLCCWAGQASKPYAASSLLVASNVDGNKKFRELYHRRRSRRGEAKAPRTPVWSWVQHRTSDWDWTTVGCTPWPPNSTTSYALAWWKLRLCQYIAIDTAKTCTQD